MSTLRSYSLLKLLSRRGGRDSIVNMTIFANNLSLFVMYKDSFPRRTTLFAPISPPSRPASKTTASGTLLRTSATCEEQELVRKQHTRGHKQRQAIEQTRRPQHKFHVSISKTSNMPCRAKQI